MLSRPLPFFVKKLNKPSDLLYINSLGIKTSHEKLYNEVKSGNIVEVEQPSNCIKCKGFISSKNSSKNEWTCPFCFSKNEIQNKLNLPENYIFRKKRIDFDKVNPTLFVICVDYSGSMGCSYFPSSKKMLIEQDLSSNNTLDYIEEHNLISRKDIVLRAIDDLLEFLLSYSDNFDIRICIIVFNREVQFLGDCKDKITIIKNLDSVQNCYEEGKKLAELYCKTRYDKILKKFIMNRLNQLQPDYSTALGPAIATGLGVVDRLEYNNNFFFVFTDGKSNIGCGTLDFDDYKNEEQKKEAREKSMKDYEKMNEFALKYYIPFHFISFEDENSNLKVFKNKLLKRMNGNLYQIQITEEKFMGKQYKLYDDENLYSHMIESASNIFEGKQFELTIYQPPNCQLRLYRKNDAHFEKKPLFYGDHLINYVLKKKPCYLEGEIAIGVYLDYKLSDFEKSSKPLQFQIQLEYFTLTDQRSEVFVSQLETHFFDPSNNEDLAYYEKKGINELQTDALEIFIKLQEKAKKNEQIIGQQENLFKMKKDGILQILKDILNNEMYSFKNKPKEEKDETGQKIHKKSEDEEEKKNNNKDSDDDEDDDEEDLPKKTLLCNEKKDLSSESSDSDDEGYGDSGDDKKTVTIQNQERKIQF